MNNSMSPSPIGQPKEPFNAKLVAIIIGAAILVGAGVFAVMYPWGAGKVDNTVLSPMSTQTPAQTLTPTPSTSAAADETAGWQTYRNEKYGFEFKYPNKWVKREIGEGDSADTIVSLVADEIIDKGSAEPWRYEVYVTNSEKLPSFAGVNLDFKEEKIGQYTAYKTYNIPSRSGSLDYFIKNKDSYIDIALYNVNLNSPFPQQEKYLDIFSKILSTFKFTK